MPAKSIFESVLEALHLKPKAQPAPSVPAAPPVPANTYVPKTDLLSLLPAELTQLVDVPMPDGDGLASGELAGIWLRGGKSHKWQHYFQTYERALAKFRGKKVRLLEIGVQHGGSLRMWKTYLGEHATIVGMDLDQACAQHDNPANSIHVRIGSQADLAFLQSVNAEFGPFDAIIDDGSHLTSHMISTFGYLFDKGLKPGGPYLVEDIQATYWTTHRDIPYSFIDFAHEVADQLHSAYHSQTGIQFFTPGHAERIPALPVPRLSTLIDGIEITDGIVLFHKSSVTRTLPVTARS